MPLSLAERLALPNPSLVFAVELTAGFEPRFWYQASGSGSTYTQRVDLDRYGLDANDSEYELTAVYANDTALTSRTSESDVETNDDSYYLDRANGHLYVSFGQPNTPKDATIVGIVKFRMVDQNAADCPHNFDDWFWAPRVLSVPSVSIRIEPLFGGVGQIGNGSLRLINSDGWFDKKANLQWNRGTCTIKLGADLWENGAWNQLDYSDYTELGTWLVSSWDVDDENVDFSLVERKSRLRRKIPFDVYTKADYPLIDDQELGTPVPRAYGYIYGARPVLIDASTSTFQVAGHAIHSFQEIYEQDPQTNQWSPISFASTDEANARFTLSGWESGTEIAVDFIGVKRASDGHPMVNPAEIVQDLLAYVGETNIYTTSFTNAAAYLDLGTDGDHLPRIEREIAVYIAEQEDALKVIGDINMAAESFLYNRQDGKYVFGIYQPEQGEDLPLYEGDPETFQFIGESDASEVRSKVICKFRENHQRQYWQVQERESDRIRRSNFGLTTAEEHQTETVETLLVREKDARQWAARYLRMRQEPLRMWRLRTSWRALTLKPGDQIRVTDTRRDLDLVLEVLEIRHSYRPNVRIDLTLGELRNWNDSSGWWVGDADTFPTRLGGGGLTWDAAWTDAQVTWARQNIGSWTDDYGQPAETNNNRGQDGSSWL